MDYYLLKSENLKSKVEFKKPKILATNKYKQNISHKINKKLLSKKENVIIKNQLSQN